MRASSALFGVTFTLAGLASEVALGASPVIHVRGAARVSATASSLEGTIVVTGAVLDDTGRPVGEATLGVKGLAADGSAVLLPAPAACPNGPVTFAAPTREGNRAERTLAADANGRFCAAFNVERTSILVFHFVDPRGLLDAAEQRIDVDYSRRGVELRLAPATATFELERETQRVQVSTHVVAAAPGLSAPLPLAVYAVRTSGEALVAQGACPVDGTTELDLASSKLTGPGPVELVLRFAGTPSLQPAEARRRVLATARVRLELSGLPAPADPADGIALDVALGSAAGAVDGGSVEARLAGQTVGIAAVEHGAARLIARFPRRADSAKLELYYLALEPWWRPGEVLAVEVKLLSRARWVSLGWSSALGAIALWLLLGWRRPQTDPGKRREPTHRAPVAGVHLIARKDSAAGWRGTVRDAHDDVPIPGATVTLLSRSSDRTIHRRVAADEQGRFELLGPAAGELDLVVGAAWHSDFTCQAPPHGELRVDLVSRRRHLVGRLVRWAERRGPFGRSRAEPTPGEVKRQAELGQRGEVVTWAAAVEAAAFGPEPVDETIEREVSRQEPAERVDPEARVDKRDH